MFGDSTFYQNNYKKLRENLNTLITLNFHMVKRGFIILLVLIVLVVPLVYAQGNETLTPVEQAYSCLKSKLGSNCGGSQNTEETAMNLLAMAYDSNTQSTCKSALKNKKNGDCWAPTGSGSCSIRSTALAILALNNIGDAPENSIEWIMDQTKSETGLTWFLEIDANNKTECTINGVKVIMEESKKFSGANPSGLVKAYNNYWFEIKDISKTYSISCDQNFITTLLYRKPGDKVFHVSSRTHSAVAYDTVEEKVESFCFTTGGECDYQGSLWATLALAKVGKDISPYLPYLSAMSNEAVNQKYMPAAFLYMLTGADDYYADLVQQQKSDQYWDESKNKLYDTALALLALQNSYAEEAVKAKDYLLSLRNTDGCWSSNTAFILYAGWPKTPLITDSGGPTLQYCENFGHFCVARGECLNLEDTLDNFYCPGLSDICCAVAPEEETCSDKGGSVCSLAEECEGDEVPADDTAHCCLGLCEPLEEDNTCELAGGFCKNACFESEEEKSVYNNACDFGQKCCVSKPEEATNWWLIILLIILIILVILAIIFRNQLKVWYFRVKNRVQSKKAPGPSKRPPTSPAPLFGRPRPPGRRPPLPRRGPSRAPTRRSAPGSRGPRDREFEETMKKLRDIGK
jgi:hypothetical protein